MSFDDSIQQLRNEQLARRSDTERFISVKTLFEQIKQRYPDQSYNALCLLVLKKYRRSEHQPSLYWFRYESWYDTPPVAPYQLLDKYGAPNIGAPDYYPDAEAALRAVSDDVMNTDKLADCGFLRTEISDALGVPLDTARPEASLYDKNRLTSAKDLLPKAPELLRLVENKIPLFWPAEGCFPMSEEQCLKILREAISLLERDVTDLHQLRVEKRQMQKTRKLNLLNQ